MFLIACYINSVDCSFIFICGCYLHTCCCSIADCLFICVGLVVVDLGWLVRLFLCLVNLCGLVDCLFGLGWGV